MRIQIVTNSQGSSVGVEPGQNYPALVTQRLGAQHDVRSLVVSGWTLADIIHNLEDNVLVQKPDIVILHVGIVEAAQRILSAREKTLLSLVPFGRLISAAMHRRRAAVLRWRKRLGISARVVAPEEFVRLLKLLNERLNSCGIRAVFVPIPLFPDAGKSMRHPYVNDDIACYNSLLAPFGCLEIGVPAQSTFFQPGTVHFTAEGHQHLADAVVREVQRTTAG